MLGLISLEEEKKLLNSLIEYYKRIYHGVEFRVEEKNLSKEEIAEVYYTYPGEEIEATAVLKKEHIKEALTKGYNTPVILLKKGNKLLLLDGHRRLKVAYDFGIDWKAFIIVPSIQKKFGIERLIQGKVKDV